MSQFANLREGTIIGVDSQMSLTDLERQAAEGTLDPKNLAIDLSQINPDIREQLKQHTEKFQQYQEEQYERRAENSELKQLPENVDFNQLPPEQQEAVKGQINEMMDSDFFKQAVPEFSFEKPEAEMTRAEHNPTPQPVEQPEPKEASTEADFHICPNCNWPDNIDPVEMSDEDQIQFLRSVLGNKRFTKTYELFGGRFMVTFRSRTVEEQDKIQEQMLKEINDGRLPSGPARATMAPQLNRLRKLQLAAGFVSVTGMTNEMPEILSETCLQFYGEDADNNVIARAADRMFKKWQGPIYDAIFKQYNRFDELCIRLTEAMASPDFWKGIDDENL